MLMADAGVNGTRGVQATLLLRLLLRSSPDLGIATNSRGTPEASKVPSGAAGDRRMRLGVRGGGRRLRALLLLLSPATPIAAGDTAPGGTSRLPKPC